MYNFFQHALTWGPLLLLPLLSNVHTASAWIPQFLCQPYFLFEFWVMDGYEVAEFVLVLEQRPANGRSAHFAQALQRGPNRQDSQSSAPNAASSLSPSSPSVVRGTTSVPAAVSNAVTPSSSSSAVGPTTSLASPTDSSSASFSSSASAALSSSASSLRSNSSVPAASLTSRPSSSPASSSFSSSSSSTTTSQQPSKQPAVPVPSGVFGDAPVNTTNKGLTFITTIKVGTQSFQAVIDTGSSDTWVIQDGYQCSTPSTGDIVADSTCNFGPTYKKSSTFTQIPDENFHQAYTDGESLSGILGTDDVTVAGITVPQQEIAVVNSAAYNGDGVSSGLLGLGFPANTRAYSGTDERQDSAQTQKIYNPIFTNMYSKGNVSPMFSIALDRSGGGQLAFGGLPPVSFTKSFASAPFQILQTTSPDGQIQNMTAYTFYTINVDGFAVGGASSSVNKTTTQMVVDSGTTQTYVPEAVADAVNYAFSPAPFYKADNGDYVISCTSKPPTFGVAIGGKTFLVDPRDMIINEGGRCISGVAATGSSGTSILGHSFLKNVVAVFDVGGQVMQFAPHVY